MTDDKILKKLTHPFVLLSIVIFCILYVAAFLTIPLFYNGSIQVYLGFGIAWAGIIIGGYLIARLWRRSYDDGDGETINKKELMT